MVCPTETQRNCAFTCTVLLPICQLTFIRKRSACAWLTRSLSWRGPVGFLIKTLNSVAFTALISTLFMIAATGSKSLLQSTRRASKILRVAGNLPAFFVPKGIGSELRTVVQSGSRGFLAPSPHTTHHAGPQWAVQRQWPRVHDQRLPGNEVPGREQDCQPCVLRAQCLRTPGKTITRQFLSSWAGATGARTGLSR